MLNAAHRAQKPVRPAKVLVIGFLVVIFTGTLLLLVPISTAEGYHTSFMTALFTATSAVCVTGLIVVDTASHWSNFGHVVIMCLIQIGGLGIMTMSTAVALVLGRRITLRERLLIREALGEVSLEGLVRLVRLILVFTFTFVLVGAVLLALRLSHDYPAGQAAWLGLFHSISAFNNAGFDLFGVSLVNYVDDPAINGVFTFLIISGGLGFTVLAELYRRIVNPETRYRKLALHTRMVLTMTAILLVAGTVFLLAMEHGNPATMGDLGWPGRIMASFFTSVTPRTAGFNTVTTGNLKTVSLFFVVMLMFVGGSAGSTAGGVKTTTFYTLVASVISTCRGHSSVHTFGRRLDSDTIHASLAIITLSLSLVVTVTLLLLITEGGSLIDCLFETTSAFGTVGLSTGVTPNLSKVGRAIITLTMFAGRLGPLTFALAFTRTQREKRQFRYPEENIIIG